MLPFQNGINPFRECSNPHQSNAKKSVAVERDGEVQQECIVWRAKSRCSKHEFTTVLYTTCYQSGQNAWRL